MMRLELSRFVEGDLEAIADYISQDNPRRSLSFVREIRAKFRVVQRQPLLYRLRPDIAADARSVSVGEYAVLYRVLADVIRIERVVHGGRDLPALFIDSDWMTEASV